MKGRYGILQVWTGVEVLPSSGRYLSGAVTEGSFTSQKSHQFCISRTHWCMLSSCKDHWYFRPL